eukprot:819551_1
MTPILEEEGDNLSLGCFEVVDEDGLECVVEKSSSLEDHPIKHASHHSSVALWDEGEEEKKGEDTLDRDIDGQVKESPSFERGTRANPQLRNFMK